MRWIESLRIASIRAGAKSILFLSTLQARVRLARTGPISVLIDTSVRGDGITHETAWIQTGTEILGPDGLTEGYAARIPVYSVDSDASKYREVRYLPGIAHLARLGHLQLRTSAELLAEVFRQPIGRFSGYGYFDLNIFRDIEISSVDGHIIDPVDAETAKQRQLVRIAACTDPLFVELVAYLGQNNSLDAYHIFTAEKHNISCFLYTESELKEKIRQARHKKWKPISNLKTLLLTPSEFGKRYGLLPIDTSILSYEDSGFPVRPDLYWPGKKRRGSKHRKKRP